MDGTSFEEPAFEGELDHLGDGPRDDVGGDRDNPDSTDGHEGESE